jgi:hypothetical protein
MQQQHNCAKVRIAPFTRSIALAVVMGCLSSAAQQLPIMTMLSPKLLEFLHDHRGADRAFTNIVSESIQGRSVAIYYYYGNDKATPKASHYFTDESSVVISVRENQTPLDEFESICFELMNSENDKKFDDISQEARLGRISRHEYAVMILQEEFKVLPRIRTLLESLELTKTEKAQSEDYRKAVSCPTNFEAFVRYINKMNSTNRDVINEYEEQYDRLRQHKSSQEGE